jgi:spermidine synthase
MFVDAPNELAAEYTKYYDLAAYFKPDFQRTLIIGGCAYSYPKYFLEKYPDKDIDVVEIDPAMTKIAREYFNLKDDENLKIIHEDGRIFLNKNQEKYDIILGDAFGSTLSIPYQLTTKEAVKAMSNSLSDDGLVVLNLISAFEGKKSQFLQAEYKTFQSIFPKVLLYQVNDKDRETTQNIILVALKQEDGSYANPDNFQSILANEYKNRVETNLPILTDNFAPVDNYLLKAI